MDEQLNLYKQWGLSLDLALEAHDLLRGERGGEVPGVKLTEEQEALASIKVITIMNSQGSEIMQKPPGTYITISSDSFTLNNHSVRQEMAVILAKQLQKIIPLKDLKQPVLIVGLGNRQATPDSLGPRVAEKIMATRHLFGHAPQQILEGVRPVSTLAPGVLGTTGIESAEMVKAVVEHIRPSLVIAIDALAAGDASRIGTTIQICDTGINPGAGVGNNRPGLYEKFLGVPVLAIGVPTVVKAKIIAHHALQDFWDLLNNHSVVRKNQFSLPQPVLAQLIEDALAPYQNNLEVTPKEIDDLINNCAVIIAEALRLSLHPNMNHDFADCFM